MNLPKGETLPGNLEFGTQDKTETLKGESQDDQTVSMFGLLGGQHVFQCILSVTKYQWWETTCQCPCVGTAYILFTRSLSLVPRVAECQQTSVLVSAHPLDYVDLQ